MKKSDRLQVIIDLQAKHEQQALEALGHCQRRLQTLLDQLQNLQNYRQDYLLQYGTDTTASMSISKLLEYRAFLDKLDQAVEAQQKSVNTQERELQKLRRDWQQKHQKTESLQKISAQARDDELKMADKREQREQDEHASRRSGIKNAK